MVLNAMCDDFENVDQIILPKVARDCTKLGLSVDRSEIVKSLSELVSDGLAKAYLLSGQIRSLENFRACRRSMSWRRDFKTYFYITKKGNGFPPFRRNMVALR